MTDGDALLAAILAQPLEDTPRLVYADYLDEQGESEHAEYIRIGVQIAILQTEKETPLRDVKLVALFTRSEQLSPFVIPKIEVFPKLKLRQDVRRGFVHSITLTTEQVQYYLDSILSRQPIQEVTLTTPPIMPRIEDWHDSPPLYRFYFYNRIIKLSEQVMTGHRIPGNGIGRSIIPHALHARWPSVPIGGWKLPTEQPTVRRAIGAIRNWQEIQERLTQGSEYD